MSIVRKSLLLLVAFVLSAQLYGQITRSPFSTFGIGESFGNALVHNQGMGGTGVSQPQFWYANNQNPALLIYNSRMTLFHAGVVGERKTITADTISQTSSAANLNYLVTAFPVKPGRWSMGISLSPYTSVNYKMQYVDQVIDRPEKILVIEEGSGGVNELAVSNGVRIAKNLAVGIKAAYLFGSIVNSYKNVLLESSQPTNLFSAIEERTYVKDFAFTAGVSYSIDSLFSRQQYRLSFGAVYEFGSDLRAKRRIALYRTDAVGGIIEGDTLASSRGQITLPSGFTGGIALARSGKWSIATEFSYRDWSTFRSVSSDDEGLGQSWRVAIGGEGTPDAFSESYLKRVTYRGGLSMEEYPFFANNSKVRDLGFNFGFSVPAGRSSLDFGLRYGKRGDRSDNLFEENYVRFFFGVSFNDQWFVKRKFE
jgi:hypothetical protein